MLHASEIEPVAPGVALWRFYDPSVKADLFTTALETATGAYLIDPVPLAPDRIADLKAQTKIAGIIVTNDNHERAAAEFAKKFEVPIYVDSTLAETTRLPGAKPVQDRSFPSELAAVEIDGAVAGEIAVHSGAQKGTMVVGDALINFEPYGFTFLPAKYCSNVKQMRRSLFKLLDHPFERMLFAHGLPILSGARERLELLLKQDR